MHPIDQLTAEHRIIEKVLDALDCAASRDMPLSFYEDAVDFIANFADGCHHAKEEERLFPVLERKGIPREQGPIGVMCSEHVLGRRYVQTMREMIAAKDIEGLRQEALEYVALLRAHIAKEDTILFPMGRNCLDDSDLAELCASFDEVAPKPEYEQLAEELLAQAGGC